MSYTQGLTTSDDILFLNLRNDVTGSITRKAYFIKTWLAADTLWYIQYMKCKHFIQPVIAYYANTEIDVYQITHYISANSYLNSWSDASSMSYFDYDSCRGGASNFIMEFDFTGVIASTPLFSFKPGSNYYLRIAVVGRFWAVPSGCEVSGGVSNSYGQKPTCFWMNADTAVVYQFDAMDVNTNLGGRYRFKLMFTASSHTTGGLYPVSASVYLYANYEAYISALDTIFTLSTNSLDRRMTTVYGGTMNSYVMGDTASTLTINNLISTASTLYISMTLQPSYAYSFSSD